MLLQHRTYRRLQLLHRHRARMIEAHDPTAIDEHQGRRGARPIQFEILFADGHGSIQQVGVEAVADFVDVFHFLLWGRLLAARRITGTLRRTNYGEPLSPTIAAE